MRITASAVLLVVVLWALPGEASAALGTKGNRSSLPEAMSADGRYLAFASGSTNLTPEGVGGVFVRDTVGGLTVLASRASGVSGTPGNAGGGAHSISADGRYVAFDSSSTNLSPDDTGGLQDVYVRDLVTATTTLVSRATGATGSKGNSSSFYPAISADGRYVAFLSYSTNLSPDDPDETFDIYVRDLATATTILASRADGVAGAKQNGGRYDLVNRVGLSADGTRVAFMTDATNLTADPGTGVDVYVRDIAAGTTVLASRANGAAGARAGGQTPALSADGEHIAFITHSPLDPADTNSAGDVYVRDLAADAITFASRADGLSGAPGNNGGTELRSISADGRFVPFGSVSTNLDPADTEDGYDVYVRDTVAGRTVLASRATGASGTKANNYSFWPVISANGRFVSFNSLATNLHPHDPDTTQDAYVRDLEENVTALESRASAPAGYPRPKGATPVQVPLVIAYEQCAVPDRVHGPPLAFQSCSAPDQSSQSITVGTPDADGSAANFSGTVRLDAVVGTPGGADDTDLAIAAAMTDVRCLGPTTACGSPNATGGADYSGEVELALTLRITDRATNSQWAGFTEAGTAADFEFPATFGCAPTADTGAGADCRLITSADALVPGAAPEGRRAVWEAGHVEVRDGGADGVVATSPNRPFARPGVFVP